MEEFVFICMGGRYTKFGTKGRGTPSALSDEEFNSIIPTVLAYNPEENRFLIGKEAVQYRSIDPANTIWNLPALLYPPLADEFVQRASESAAFKIEVDEDRECSVCFDDNWYSVKEIVRYYIVELKHTIEKSLNKAFEKAVFTVPHGATVNHRKALVEAAENAGFTTVRLITEPMAAVVGSEYPHTDDEVLCNVYLGFSTAGVSVVEKEDGVYEQIAIFGEVQPGLWKGDLEIARILADSLQGNPNVRFTEGSPNFDRLWAAAADLRESAASETGIQVSVENIDLVNGDKSRAKFSLTFEQISEVYDELFEWIADSAVELKSTVKSAKLLVYTEEYIPFEKLTSKAEQTFSLPVEVVSEYEHKSVVMGASVLSGILEGGVPDLIILDTSFYNLGIAAGGNDFMPIIKSLTGFPVTRTETFTTSEDNQTEVSFTVYEGLEEDITKNTYIGSYTLTDIPPKAAGEAQIEITFTLDANGVLKISGKETQSGIQLNTTENLE